MKNILTDNVPTIDVTDVYEAEEVIYKGRKLVLLYDILINNSREVTSKYRDRYYLMLRLIHGIEEKDYNEESFLGSHKQLINDKKGGKVIVCVKPAF